MQELAVTQFFGVGEPSCFARIEADGLAGRSPRVALHSTPQLTTINAFGLNGFARRFAHSSNDFPC